MILSAAKDANLPKMAQEILDAHGLLISYPGLSTNQRLDGYMYQSPGAVRVVLHEQDIAHNGQLRSNAISPEMQAAVQATIEAHVP